MLVTDADGTLWSGDVGEDAFARLLQENALRPACHPWFAELAARSSLPAPQDPNELGRILFAAYEAGRLGDEGAYRAMALAFAGFREDEARALVRRAQTGLAARLTDEMKDVLAWAARAGVPVWVVSASPRIVVDEALRSAGVPVAGTVGLELTTREGLLSAPLLEPIPYGPGKVSALRSRLPDADLLAAFGDSGFDADLLRASRHPCAVRPKRRLVEESESIPGSVRLVPGA